MSVFNKKFVLDILMFVVFIIVMSFPVFPKLLHEVFGVTLSIIICLHLFWNRFWFSSIFKGQQNIRRFLPTIINILLIFSILAVVITGVCLSNYLFKSVIPIDLARNVTIHQIHVSISYLTLILIGLHFGLHLKAQCERLKNTLNLRINPKLIPLVSIIIVLLGIYASFLNRLGDRLLMKHIFATPATNKSGIIYILLLLSIFGMYAVIAYIWQNGKKTRR